MLSACNDGKQPAKEPEAEAEPADTTPAGAEKDSTIYGTSGEFGMSTFTLLADRGDTLYVTRTSQDGIDGKIYGDLIEGDRYALTTRDNGEAIGVLINLSQLERHEKEYKISNGHLIIRNDTVKIVRLDDKELKTR